MSTLTPGISGVMTGVLTSWRQAYRVGMERGLPSLSAVSAIVRALAVEPRSRAYLMLRLVLLAVGLHKRTLLWLVGGVLAACLLGPRVGELGRGIQSLGSVSLGWLLAAALSSLLLYPMAAIAQMGAVHRSLALGRMLAVQVAATFVAQLTPQGIGGMGLNGRYLEKQGVGRPEALAAVTLNMAAGAFVHVVATVVVFVLIGRDLFAELDISITWPLPLALACAMMMTGAALQSPVARRSVVSPAISAARSAAGVLRRPVRAVQLFGGSAGITAAYALTFVLCARAFGVDVSTLDVIAVYLGGAAVGALVPTPGGLGAIETALVAGLATVGVGMVPAVAVVSVFRLLTFWLPILPGFLAFRWLQRRGLL